MTDILHCTLRLYQLYTIDILTDWLTDCPWTPWTLTYKLNSSVGGIQEQDTRMLLRSYKLNSSVDWIQKQGTFKKKLWQIRHFTSITGHVFDRRQTVRWDGQDSDIHVWSRHHNNGEQLKVFPCFHHFSKALNKLPSVKSKVDGTCSELGRP